MKQLIISEYRKFFSTRMWWILLVAMTAYMAVTAAGLAATFAFADALNSNVNGEPLEVDAEQAVATVMTTASSFGYIFPALIGALSFTGEFRHQTIVPTFVATPNRTKVLLAKMVSGIPMGAIFGVLGTLVCALAGGAVLALGGISPGFGSLSTWETFGRSSLALTLWLLFGVALGSVLKNQAVVVVLLIAFTQLIEPIARLALPLWDATAPVSKFLPGAVGDAISGASLYASIPGTPSLAFWAGLAVMIAYIAGFAVLGRVTTLRKDI